MSHDNAPRDATPHGPTPPERGPTGPDNHEALGGGLSGTSIRRPIFTLMMMLGLIVLGLFSYIRLPIDQFPDVEIPVVAVQTIYPGASPETIEREVTRPMEEAFNPVEGVDRISSNSLEVRHSSSSSSSSAVTTTRRPRTSVRASRAFGGRCRRVSRSRSSASSTFRPSRSSRWRSHRTT